MGIAKARKEAKAAIAAVQSGGDPVAEKRRAREVRRLQQAERRGAGTVASRLAEWQASRKADPAGPWSPKYAAEVKRVCDQAIVPKLGDRVLVQTRREDWTRLIAGWRAAAARPKAKPKPGETGKSGAPGRDGAGAAAFLYRTVSAFLNFAEVQGWIPAPLLPRRGAGVIAPPPPARERVLTDAELLAVWRAADREPPKLRAFVRLLILTGAREAEVADIAAGELNLEAARWAIPGRRTKNGVGYVLPLSALALAELRAVLPNEEPEACHRLLGRDGGSGFKGFGRLKTRMDLAAKVPAWRWHDLRRTVRTGMARLGVSPDHAEAAINHVSHRTKLERTYDRHDYAPEVLVALALWQAHVASLVREAAEVVRLPDRHGS
jgi:integrase